MNRISYIFCLTLLASIYTTTTQTKAHTSKNTHGLSSRGLPARLLCGCDKNTRKERNLQVNSMVENPHRRLCPASCHKDKEGHLHCNLPNRKLSSKAFLGSRRRLAPARRLCGCKPDADGTLWCSKGRRLMAQMNGINRNLVMVKCFQSGTGKSLCATQRTIGKRFRRRLCSKD
jgi:hypothetical protein